MDKLIRFHSDERVDLDDAEAIGGGLDLANDMLKNRIVFLPEGRNVGAAATEARILSGFEASYVGAVLTLNRGSGFFKIIEEGQLYFGLITGENGLASYDIDFSGEPNDTYKLFVRFVYVDAEKENRVHWDTVSAAEYVDHVDTRRSLAWTYTYVASTAADPSGGDWVRVHDVTVFAGAITGTDDYRHYYFEGDASPAVSQWAEEWGTGTDRNADRALYGVQDFHRYVQAMRTKIGDIQGTGYEWYEVPDPDLTDLAAEHLADSRHGDVDAATLQIRDGSVFTFNTDTGAAPFNGRMLYIRADDNANDGELVLDVATTEDSARLALQPRGRGNTFVNADFGEFCIGPDNAGARHGLRATITSVALTQYSYAIGLLSGTPALRIDQGVAATARGAYLTEASARYFGPSRTEDIYVQPHIDADSGGNWTHTGDQWVIAAGHAGDMLYMRLTDWPVEMTLNSIEIKVELAGAAANALTVTANKYTWQAAPATIAGVAMGNTNTLANGVSDLSIVVGAGFNPWTHDYHMIQIQIAAPNVAATFHGLRLNVDYTTISKWAMV